MNKLTEDIPVTTSTESTTSTTSLENVEINIIQKQPGHHSKSKGVYNYRTTDVLRYKHNLIFI